MVSHFDGQNYGGYQSDEPVETPEAKNARWTRGAVNGRAYCHVIHDDVWCRRGNKNGVCTYRNEPKPRIFRDCASEHFVQAFLLFSPHSQGFTQIFRVWIMKVNKVNLCFPVVSSCQCLYAQTPRGKPLLVSNSIAVVHLTDLYGNDWNVISKWR